MRRFLLGSVDLLLVAALVAGIYLTSRASTDLSRLRRQHAELVDVVGLLTVEDPEKIHVVRVPTNDPLHWKWRVYVPAGVSLHFVGVAGEIAASGPRAASPGRGWASEGPSLEPRELLLEAKVFFEGDTPRSLRHAWPGGTSAVSLPQELSPLLPRLGNRITITVAGEGKIEQFSADEPVFLLRMRLNEEQGAAESPQEPELAPGAFLAIVPSSVFPQFEQDMDGHGQ